MKGVGPGSAITHLPNVVELMDLCQILGLDVAALIAEVRDETSVGRRKRPPRCNKQVRTPTGLMT